MTTHNLQTLLCNGAKDGGLVDRVIGVAAHGIETGLNQILRADMK